MAWLLTVLVIGESMRPDIGDLTTTGNPNTTTTIMPDTTTIAPHTTSITSVDVPLPTCEQILQMKSAIKDIIFENEELLPKALRLGNHAMNKIMSSKFLLGVYFNSIS